MSNKIVSGGAGEKSRTAGVLILLSFLLSFFPSFLLSFFLAYILFEIFRLVYHILVDKTDYCEGEQF